ncbi:MAG: CD225/dispanin family protein [Muribaculaceae bacterium]|nr:CD225/dispanin family protein [Muribaculaceae bacterium]
MNNQDQPSFPQQPQLPQYQQPAYYQPDYAQEQRPPKPDNYLVWAILCTLLCCLPLGIVSIIYSSKVDGLYSSGDYAAAQDASKKAKNFAMWGALSGIIILVVYVVGILLLGLFEASA